MTALDQQLDELDHLRHVARGVGLVGGPGDVEQPVGTGQLGRHLVGEVVPRTSLVGCLGEDLVVDVGGVADEGHPVTGRTQPALEHVEVHTRADVTDVGLRLHGQPAQIDADLALAQGHEVAHGAGGRVMDAERHSAILGGNRGQTRTRVVRGQTP